MDFFSFLPNLVERRIEFKLDASDAIGRETIENSEENNIYFNPSIGTLLSFIFGSETKLPLDLIRKAYLGELETQFRNNFN